MCGRGVVLSLFLFAVGPTSAATLRVPQDYATIQEGLAAAGAGDSVVIACGTYAEHDLVMAPGVVLRSDTGDPSCVTIDAANLGRVLYCSDVDETTVIEGLTLTRGRATRGAGIYCGNASPQIRRCNFTGNEASGGRTDGGGGLYCLDSSPIVTGCRFWRNWGSEKGGGMHFRGPTAHVTLRDCVFVENTSISNDVGGGGGLWILAATATIEDCEFSANRARGLSCNGGAVLCQWVQEFTLARCEIADNVAGDHEGTGPGGLDLTASSVAVVDTNFRGNRSFGGGSGWVGGVWVNASVSRWERCVFDGNTGTYVSAIWARGDLEMTGCAFTRNDASWDYGGSVVRVELSESARLSQCTFSRNVDQVASVGSGASALSVENCIFAHEPSPTIACATGTSLTMACTDVFGNGGDWVGCLAGHEGIDGNFSGDPRFCGPAIGDFHLQWGSPCLPANAGGCGLIGAYGFGGCSSVSVVPESFGRIKAKFRSPDGPATER